MFEFKPSTSLTQKILDNLRNELGRLSISAPAGFGEHIELIRTQWGRNFVDTIGMYAQRCRHGWNEPDSFGTAKESFCILQNGSFAKMLGNDIGADIPIPEGEAGDKLMQELATEFLAWIKEHRGSAGLNPRAPITKLEVQGENVLAYVRPYVPPPKDPNFVRATRVE